MGARRYDSSPVESARRVSANAGLSPSGLQNRHNIGASTDTGGESAYGFRDAPGSFDHDGRMIGICTDSNSQLPSELAERFGVEVVPLTVAIDDREYLEGVDLSVDDFYELYRDGHRPAVRCNQPSPGQFAGAYDDLVARGCTEILSIHTGAQAGSTCSSTLRAARLGAHSVPVPVRIVDSGTARFQISCCCGRPARPSPAEPRSTRPRPSPRGWHPRSARCSWRPVRV
ncbi:MAG: hypothetical protein JWN39_1792 [Ilumatobacteraceae bacterium]|nr:hypothetical protein [Ilumatobacteraceae bacterium]